MKDGAFVSRPGELDWFTKLLGELPTGRPRNSAGWSRLRRKVKASAEASQSSAVLIHGISGSGKSRLLRHLRELADGSGPDPVIPAGRIKTVWLDLDEKQRRLGSYPGVEGPSLDAMLNGLQRAVIGAFGEHTRGARRAERAFGDYRNGVLRMREADGHLLPQGRQGESSFTGTDAATLVTTGASFASMLGNPVNISKLTPAQLAASAEAGGRLYAAVVRALTGKKQGTISLAEFDLVTDDPAPELTRRMAAALRKVAAVKPLVIFLDTGGVIGDRTWDLLSQVIKRTGPRVTWVVGGHLDAGSMERFVQEIGDLKLRSPTPFDGARIREYLENRTPGRAYTDADVDLIAQFTRGSPLTVILTAAVLLKEGRQVEEVCREVEGGLPSSIVSELAWRFLQAGQESYPAGEFSGDVAKILGLALAFGDLCLDPDPLRALWDDQDPLTTLGELARRYDFIQPQSRKLHDDVRDTLRTYLLDPYNRDRVRELNQRALNLFTTRLSDMRLRWPSLDEQLHESDFTTSLLSVLWHTLWLNNQAGIDLFIQIMPVLAVADRSAAEDALGMLWRFSGTFSESQQDYFNRFDLQALDFEVADPVIGNQQDRKAALLILKALGHVADLDDGRALTALAEAGDRTTSTRLRQVIDSRIESIFQRIMWSGPRNASQARALRLGISYLLDQMVDLFTDFLHDAGGREDEPSAHHRVLPFGLDRLAIISRRKKNSHARGKNDILDLCDEALAHNPENGVAHILRGIVLSALRRPQDALAAFDRGLEFAPDEVYVQGMRGMLLYSLQRFGEALTALDLALGADPNDIDTYAIKGMTLIALGRPREALVVHDQARALDPDQVAEHSYIRQIALLFLGRLDEALDQCNQALATDPHDAYVRSVRGMTLLCLGRPNDALAECEEALAIDPDNTEANAIMGNALHALGRHAEALSAYDRLIVLDPAEGDGHAYKGFALTAMGELDAAMSELDAAERLAPDGTEGEISAWKGAILWHRGSVAAAREQFARVEGRVFFSMPFYTATLEAIALCALRQPENAEQRLLRALPLRVPGDRVQSRALYDLLSKPPLDGCDRLRAIADGIID